jgi:UDP-N-acetyl-D-mannosaminuronic acid dehydrogenase
MNSYQPTILRISGVQMSFDAVVIGGGGHVGLPLAIMLASRGVNTAIYDISKSAVDGINSGKMPFWEPGAEKLLQESLEAKKLIATTDPSVTGETDSLIVVIGTPVDEHLNPDPQAITLALERCQPYLRNGQLLILRSTIYPGVTRQVERELEAWGLDIDVAFAPERIAEHNAVEELVSLPQIVSSRTQRGFDRASELFSRIAPAIVRLSPEEAELAKLFTNTWRYVKFAMANQFYMMAESKGLYYENIRSAIRQDYPRAADVPSAGFAAGPCLFKDTMQLAAFSDNNFHLGHSAMLVNEGMPSFIVSQLESKYDLSNMTVGILGMAFKAGSDDIRSSLSYKLKRVLKFRAKKVLTTDPMVPTSVDKELVPLDQVLLEADILILATPHREYKDLVTDKPLVDMWGITPRNLA